MPLRSTMFLAVAMALSVLASNALGRIWVVDRRHPDASDDAEGTTAAPLKTIGAAARQAQPGDTVRIHAGVYREMIVPARGGAEGKPITYEGAPDEKVIVRGSDVYDGAWTPGEADGVYTAKLPTETFGDRNPYAMRMMNLFKDYRDELGDKAHRLTLGQVFVDGRMLEQVDSEEDLLARPGTWLAGGQGKSIRVHFSPAVVDPSRHEVEYALRRAVVRPERRGLGYITIRNLHLEHAANEAIGPFWAPPNAPQAGLLSCRSGHHWTIENCSIRFATSIGIDIGSEQMFHELDGQPAPKRIGWHIIRNNVISDNGQSGIVGLGHIGVQILGNVLERNNSLGGIAWEEAAIKTHYMIRGRIEGNLIRDNRTVGIWLDNVYQDVRVTRNVILGNSTGIFCEMGAGPALIDNNVIGMSVGQYSGCGVYAHDASGLTIVHNLLIQNAGYGVFLTKATGRTHNVYPSDIQSWETERIDRRLCVASNETIRNNVFVWNERGEIHLPYPGKHAEGNVSDANLFVQGPTGSVRFVANAKGGDADLQQIRRKLAEAEAEADLAAAERIEPVEYQGGWLMTLAQWRLLMGMDAHSRVTRAANKYWQEIHPGRGPWVAMRFEDAPSDVACAPVDGVDRDFFGKPIPSRPVPGPFQEMADADYYRFVLWPIATPPRRKP